MSHCTYTLLLQKRAYFVARENVRVEFSIARLVIAHKKTRRKQNGLFVFDQREKKTRLRDAMRRAIRFFERVKKKKNKNKSNILREAIDKVGIGKKTRL